MTARAPWLSALADDTLEVVCEECGFDPDESAIYQFRRAVIESESHDVEFRFIGALGFGGKFHLHIGHFAFRQNGRSDYRCYVSCYPEDRTPERERMIAVANARLAEIADRYASTRPENNQTVPKE